ncbi:MAG: gamma-glutamylcyclotransferase [Myxococcales bacterium]|nr:gamma-glutamylcyclotransferase [Myxococcales bacterium]
MSTLLPSVYFAYGSNLDPRTFLGRRRMRPERATCARLEGYRLVFDLPVGPGERGVANLRAEPGAEVFGVAYWLDFADAGRLDRSEGVHRGFYLRRGVDLDTPTGAVAAFTYVSGRGEPGRRPSRRYLNLILRGARHHRLPPDYIEELRALPLAIDERERAQGELF